jgi:hypothetical protein
MVFELLAYEKPSVFIFRIASNVFKIFLGLASVIEPIDVNSVFIVSENLIGVFVRGLVHSR